MTLWRRSPDHDISRRGVAMGCTSGVDFGPVGRKFSRKVTNPCIWHRHVLRTNCFLQRLAYIRNYVCFAWFEVPHKGAADFKSSGIVRHDDRTASFRGAWPWKWRLCNTSTRWEMSAGLAWHRRDWNAFFFFFANYHRHLSLGIYSK